MGRLLSLSPDDLISTLKPRYTDETGGSAPALRGLRLHQTSPRHSQGAHRGRRLPGAFGAKCRQEAVTRQVSKATPWAPPTPSVSGLSPGLPECLPAHTDTAVVAVGASGAE